MMNFALKTRNFELEMMNFAATWHQSQGRRLHWRGPSRTRSELGGRGRGLLPIFLLPVRPTTYTICIISRRASVCTAVQTESL